MAEIQSLAHSLYNAVNPRACEGPKKVEGPWGASGHRVGQRSGQRLYLTRIPQLCRTQTAGPCRPQLEKLRREALDRKPPV